METQSCAVQLRISEQAFDERIQRKCWHFHIKGLCGSSGSNPNHKEAGLVPRCASEVVVTHLQTKYWNLISTEEVEDLMLETRLKTDMCRSVSLMRVVFIEHH